MLLIALGMVVFFYRLGWLGWLGGRSRTAGDKGPA